MLNQVRTEFSEKISSRDILNKFYNFMPKTEMLIGMELERLPVDKKGYAVVYDDEKNGGVKQILNEISSVYGWGKLYNDNVLIGLKKGNTTITLEPGCQFEISMAPQKSVVDLKKEIEKIDKNIFPIFKKFRANLLEYGISPKSTAKDIEVFPKARYKYMANYLPGALASSMMRETAGIRWLLILKMNKMQLKNSEFLQKFLP